MKKSHCLYLSVALMGIIVFNVSPGCTAPGKGTNPMQQENTRMESDMLISKSETALPVSKEPELKKNGHHTENGFQNIPIVKKAESIGPAFYFRRVWHSLFLHDVPDGHVLSYEKAMQQQKGMAGDTITWLGHATFLIKFGGKMILTDPFLTKYASPSSFGGPQRMVPPGIPIEHLPKIDVIVVSHNHYDHLDDDTIRQLPNKDQIQVMIPLGLRPFFKERGYTNINELDWHDTINLNSITFSCLPAVHNSGRSLWDKNKTLWASWVISNIKKVPAPKLFFIGDSAYSDTIFKWIGKEHGPFDHAIVPIGAYEPRQKMETHHMTPEESVKAGLDLRAATLIASHWGTINLSDEWPWDPPKRMLKSAGNSGIMQDNVWIMKIGETRALFE